MDILRQQQAMPGPELVSLLLKAVDELRAMIPMFAAGATSLRATGTEKAYCARSATALGKDSLAGRNFEGEMPAAQKVDSLPGIAHRTLRADVDRLDHILNLTGEIVTAQNRLRQMIERLGADEGHALLEMHREAERLYGTGR